MGHNLWSTLGLCFNFSFSMETDSKQKDVLSRSSLWTVFRRGIFAKPMKVYGNFFIYDYLFEYCPNYLFEYCPIRFFVV